MNSTTHNARRTLLLTALPAGLVLLLAFVARFIIDRQLPMPRCLLRELTGVPCPTCGGTRSLAALAEFDWPTAWSMNPLVFAACGAALLLVGDQLVALRRNRRAILPALAASLPSAWIWSAMAVVVVSNWLYLCLTLPR